LWGEFSGQPPPPPPPDTTPPTQPGNPTKTSSTQTSVSMSWAPSTDNVGVTSYVVYRNGSGIAFTPGSQTNYTDTGLACGTTYTYGVRAGDAAGNVSTMATASLSTDACTPPPNPQCSDGVDNDLDGKIAYPADPGCSSATDDSESPDPPPPPPPPGSETLSDVADAYTDASQTTTNYGTQTVLWADGSPIRRVWLKFQAPSITATSAKLRFYVQSSASSSPVTVNVAPESWTETGLTAGGSGRTFARRGHPGRLRLLA
jgi:hypothetical protein